MAEELPKSAGVLALEKLRKGLDNFVETHWPGAADFPIVLVTLSVDAMQVAQARAEERFKSIGLELSILNSDDFANELHCQVLSRAMRDPEDHTKHLFRDADDLRPQLTNDESTVLTSSFIALQSDANPVPEEMSDELFEKIELAIKKKDVIQLSSIGSRTLSSYLLSLESQQSI